MLHALDVHQPAFGSLPLLVDAAQADAVEKAHTVLASQFVNEAFAKHAGVKDEQMGLGHAYEIDPGIENSFLLELAQAQLIRQVFPSHPIKWMPPTKFKSGDLNMA
jgi:beta-lysine 5,6-aminomutase alpha subunit